VLLVSTRTCYEGINFGASRVVFIESHQPCLQARLRENCLHLPRQERVIVKADVLLHKHKW
jgi:hypothetical protein